MIELLFLSMCMNQMPDADAIAALALAKAARQRAVVVIEPKSITYFEVYGRVQKGESFTLYVGTPLPKDAGKNAIHFKTLSGFAAGVYDCSPGAGGIPVMTERATVTTRSHEGNTVAKPKSTTLYTDPTGQHRHKCDLCGTVWSHGAGGNVSHNCPTCGREQLYVYEWYDSPSNVAPKATITTKPKRTSFGGKWYDLHADGTLTECADCNRR